MPQRLVVIAALGAALLLEPSLAIAHDIGYPHADPAPQPKDSASAPSEVIILIGVVLALMTVALLVWLKNHDFGGDDDSAETEAPNS